MPKDKKIIYLSAIAGAILLVSLVILIFKKPAKNTSQTATSTSTSSTTSISPSNSITISQPIDISSSYYREINGTIYYASINNSTVNTLDRTGKLTTYNLPAIADQQAPNNIRYSNDGKSVFLHYIKNDYNQNNQSLIYELFTQKIIDLDSRIIDLSWSKDNKKIYYTFITDSSHYKFASADSDGKNFKIISDNLNIIYPYLSPSPDGRFIVLYEDQNLGDLIESDNLSYPLYIYYTESGAITQLTTSGESYQPTWNTDSTKIAYLKQILNDGNASLGIYDLKTSKEQILHPINFTQFSPYSWLTATKLILSIDSTTDKSAIIKYYDVTNNTYNDIENFPDKVNHLITPESNQLIITKDLIQSISLNK